MRGIPDSRDWYVSDNLEISSTCFHLVMTDSGCMFDFRNSLIWSQQFVTIGILPIIYSKRFIQMGKPICPPISSLYEF